MLTVHDDTKLMDAFKAGAHGYLVKNVRSEELLGACAVSPTAAPVRSTAMAPRILDEFRRTSEVLSDLALTSRRSKCWAWSPSGVRSRRSLWSLSPTSTG